MTRQLLVTALAAALSGCMVGPNYKRPPIAAPPQFRAGEQQPSQTSLGDVRWFNLFQDSTLHDLIAEAVKANYDIRIAAARVEHPHLVQAQRGADRDDAASRLRAALCG